MGLFALLRTPLTYMESTQMIAAIHESFLWVKDLCQPDSWILPFIAGITTYFTGSLGMTQTSGGGTPNGAMGAVTKYFFPIFIFMIGRSFPAGLALYWAEGNFFMIFQTMFLNKLREKEKFRDEIIAEEKEKRRKAREAAKKNS